MIFKGSALPPKTMLPPLAGENGAAPPTQKPDKKPRKATTVKKNAKLGHALARASLAEAEALELSGSLEALIAAMDTAWPGEVKSSKTVDMARGWARESLAKCQVASEVRKSGIFTITTGRKDKDTPEVKAMFDATVSTHIGQWGAETHLRLVQIGGAINAPDMIFESKSVTVQLAHLFNTPLRVTFKTTGDDHGQT